MGSMEQRTPWGAKWLASPLGGVLPLALAATGLVPGFTFNQHDYIHNPSFRDFFYVTRKSTPST